MTEEQKIIQAYNNAHMKIGFLIMDIEALNKANIQLQTENQQLKQEIEKLSNKSNKSKDKKEEKED